MKEYENKIALLTQEIERLNMVIKTIHHDFDDFRRKYSDLERKFEEMKYYGEKNKEYENRIKILLDEVENCRTQLRKFEVCERKLQEAENKIGFLSQEIERLNHILKQKCEELEDWKHKYMDLESESHGHKNRAETVKRAGAQEKQYLQSEIARLSELLDSKNHENEDLKIKCSKLEININENRGI